MTLNYEIEVDPSDPWVEAFDLEREQGATNIDVVPDWYTQNIERHGANCRRGYGLRWTRTR